jgi:hypothetical protein
MTQPATTTDRLAKAISYEPATRDFAMFLGGDLVGYARTYSDAETTLDELIYELLTRHPEAVIEPAA